MKIGVRKPSIKRSIKARTTGKLKRQMKSTINPLYGKKGMGLVNDPKNAVYNKVYNKTTVGVTDVLNNSNSSNSKKEKNFSPNSQLNAEPRLYTIFSGNKVTINNKEYSLNSIKVFKNIFMFFAILFGIIGIITIPIGILFIIFALFMYSMAKTYKKIYNEMILFQTDEELNN